MTIPLRVCKAVTMHKSQGLTVGEGQVWELLVVVLSPTKGGSTTPGLEQVAFSRATAVKYLACASTEGSLSRERLLKIGKSPAYQIRRVFEAQLRELQETTTNEMKQLIGHFDTEEGDFNEGYNCLVKWYRERTNQH